MKSDTERIAELETTVRSHDIRLTAHGKEIDTLRDKQSGLEIRLASIDERIKGLSSDVADTKTGVESINGKLDDLKSLDTNLHYVEPLKRWQSLAIGAFGVLLGAVVMALAKQIGLLP